MRIELLIPQLRCVNKKTTRTTQAQSKYKDRIPTFIYSNVKLIQIKLGYHS